MTSDLLSAISIVIGQSNLTFISVFRRSYFRPKSVNSCPRVLRITLAERRDLHRPEESPPHPGKILINKAQSGPRSIQQLQLLSPLGPPSDVCQFGLLAPTSPLLLHKWLLQNL